MIRFGTLLAVVLLAGCQSAPTGYREQSNTPPTSHMSRSEAVNLAALWQLADTQHRSYSFVSATGSMLPVLGSNSVLLLESVTVADLKKNDIAIYENAAGNGTIVHRAKAVSPDGVYFEGDNNTWPDGWIKPDRIRWRVAGILYTSP